MSLTRFFCLIVTLALLVIFCCIPTLAASQYSYVFDWDTSYLGFLNYDTPPDYGNYQYTLSLRALGSNGVIQSVSQSGVCSLIELSQDGITVPYCSIMLDSNVDGLQLVALLNFFFINDVVGFNIIESDFRGSDGFSIELDLEKITYPGFTESINSGIDYIISWIGNLTDQLITGDLSPLLGIMAVAISVTILVFAVHAIHKFTWG